MVDGWMDRQAAGWMDGWIDGGMDGCLNLVDGWIECYGCRIQIQCMHTTVYSGRVIAGHCVTEFIHTVSHPSGTLPH